MDAIVEDKDALFDEVSFHLAEVQAQPQTKLLDEELLRRAEKALDASSSSALLWQILNTGESLLSTLRQDLRPLTRLLERTVLLIPFDELQTTISAPKLIEGLTSLSIPVQLLCLAYLKKASDIPSGASFVACSPDLVETIITTWLTSESTEIAERALEAVVALLTVDSPGTITYVSSQGSRGEAAGQGLLWKRIFQDPDIYVLLFAWTSYKRSRYDFNTKKGLQAVTISQARLFDFVAQAASLNWPAVTTSLLPDIERDYSTALESDDTPYGGILQYAADGMVDVADFLMEALRQDFFVKLLTMLEENNPAGVSQRAFKAIQWEAGVDPGQNGDTNGMHL